jgi:hypothetical protein
LEKTSVTGAITTATSEHAGPIDKEHYYNIGKKIYTCCPTTEKYGLKVSLDAASKWTVAKTSYMTGLTLADGATITAPSGNKVTMTFDGVATAIKAGNFAGAIELKVTPA